MVVIHGFNFWFNLEPLNREPMNRYNKCYDASSGLVFIFFAVD